MATLVCKVGLSKTQHINVWRYSPTWRCRSNSGSFASVLLFCPFTCCSFLFSLCFNRFSVSRSNSVSNSPTTSRYTSHGRHDADPWYMELLLESEYGPDCKTEENMFIKQLPLRRKSTRRSLVFVADHVSSPKSSSANLPGFRDTVEPHEQYESQLRRAEVPAVSTPAKPRIAQFDGSAESTDLMERYEREIASWRLLLESSVPITPNEPTELPPWDWIKSDRVLSDYQELLQPMFETNLTGLDLTEISELQSRILFGLMHLRELLDTQDRFMLSLRRSMQAICTHELGLNNSRDMYGTTVGAFLALPP
ncbi:hypothetical protein CRM22_008252 [Opisthorchis felineus]|uniref:Uncharacterized protein n=1 Tax=Opisthorchis felineus TaxID=147828 RepID=A0A4S2LKD4_OPIFE|nr:hypothetical protein CRM22_008252 [Opisthorchis felineus]